MGFLDMFDNPNILSVLLGGPSTPTTSPPAPQGPVPLPPPRPDIDLPPNAAPTAGVGPVGGPVTAAPPRTVPSQLTPAPAPAAPAPVPTAPALAAPATSPSATPVSGGPLSVAAPPLPPTSQFVPPAAPPTSLSGSGLSGALGLDPNTWRAALGGLGHGLSAVGQIRPGTPGAAAFAAGAGGALQGNESTRNTLDQRDLQHAQFNRQGQNDKFNQASTTFHNNVSAAQLDRQNQADRFNQSSTAFRDMLAAKTANDVEGYRKAQAEYLRARAQSVASGGNARGTNAWQNTPYGQVMGIETKAQQFEKAQQIVLQKQWTLNGATADAQKKDLEDLAKKVDDYRKRLYGTAGIDPNKAAKIKDMGTSKDNPFDTKGMSIDQFHDQVPMGGWFKDQNGTVRQRTVPPPGMGGSSSAAPGGPVSSNDDELAMTPAA